MAAAGYVVELSFGALGGSFQLSGSGCAPPEVPPRLIRTEGLAGKVLERGHHEVGTAGQPDAGVLSGGGYSLGGGFWKGGLPAGAYRIYLPLVLWMMLLLM